MTERLFEAIGKVTAEIEGLRRDVEKMDNTARLNRSLMYDRMSDVSDRLIHVEESVDDIQKDITGTITPAVITVRNWEQRGIGMLSAAGLVGTGIGILFTTLLKDVWNRIFQ